MSIIDEIYELVTKFFDGDSQKTMLWINTKNPMLGDWSPNEMFLHGREDKVLKFVKEALANNKPVHCTKENPWDNIMIPVLHVDAALDGDTNILICPNCGYSWSIGPDA